MNRLTALELLDWGQTTNPGPWREHSLGVARAAESIARECGDMDPEKAWIMGAMHDIGRYEGVYGLRHAIAGYRLMLEKGEPEIARICLTHSFPLPDIDAYMGKQDISAEDREIIVEALSIPMDDHDRLIQLCDALSWGEGVCLIEKRLIDVIRRHGCAPLMKEKIDRQMGLFNYFQNKIGKSVYSLFPEAIENTFGLQHK